MNIKTCIESLKGTKCWSVVAGPGAGSVIGLGFGKKLPREKPSKNTTLSQDELKFDPEIGVLIHCAWRLSKSDKILCGWRDSNELNGEMLRGIMLLRDKKVEDVFLHRSTYDLEIYYEDSLCLQIFCDQTNDFDSDDNYTLFFGGHYYTVGLKSKLELDYKE